MFSSFKYYSSIIVEFTFVANVKTDEAKLKPSKVHILMSVSTTVFK